MSSLKSAAPALAAALLFGASTPLAKLLVGETPPLLLAGLLYLGSGLGLALAMLARWAWRRTPETGLSAMRIPRSERPWLLGAIVAGGVLGPALLMAGLATADAAAASLLLNMEGVLTAVLAWVVLREYVNKQFWGHRVSRAVAGLTWPLVLDSLSPDGIGRVASCTRAP